ncbi:MAG TPA: RDD family protein [Blastocatellia bacterium]|nr:RDD family protein [Blastocatellia bacterium]
MRTSESEPAEASLPAWRIELNEKVRARKAKQGSEDEIESAAAEPAPPPEPDFTHAPSRETITTVSQARESHSFYSDDTYSRRRRTEANPRASFSPAALQTASSDNPIVQAALSRARRASENASRAALPRIESNRAVSPAAKNSFSIDREATARVLEPAPELSTAVADSLPADAVAPVTKPERVEPAPVPRIVGPAPLPRIVATPPIVEDDMPRFEAAVAEPASVTPIDEIEPCDYLEAEVRRVDKALSAEFSRNESPALGTHVVINVIDLIVVAMSGLPFLAAIGLTNGSFASAQTRVASIAIVAVVAFFYLALTHCLCGKTVGMMLTNTRIVDATSFDNPSRKQALVRALGYFVAAAPAMLGLLWMIGNRKRRGWHDFISGTFVARDF